MDARSILESLVRTRYRSIFGRPLPKPDPVVKWKSLLTALNQEVDQRLEKFAALPAVQRCLLAPASFDRDKELLKLSLELWPK